MRVHQQKFCGNIHIKLRLFFTRTFEEDQKNGYSILKKDLTALRKDFKALEKKMEKLLKAFDSSSKPGKVSKPKSVKTAVAPKATAKKAPDKKAPAPKKAVEVTATDQVMNIIKRSKKGVDVPTLKNKTGFDDKKVRNIVFRFQHCCLHMGRSS